MLLIERLGGGVRCALCHDDLDSATAAECGCGAVLHVECRAGLGRCPTLGCAPRSTNVTLSLLALTRHLIEPVLPYVPFVIGWLVVILIALAGIVWFAEGTPRPSFGEKL